MLVGSILIFLFILATIYVRTCSKTELDRLCVLVVINFCLGNANFKTIGLGDHYFNSSDIYATVVVFSVLENLQCGTSSTLFGKLRVICWFRLR